MSYGTSPARCLAWRAHAQATNEHANAIWNAASIKDSLIDVAQVVTEFAVSLAMARRDLDDLVAQ